MAWVEQLPSGRYRGMYRVGGRKKSVGTFPTEKTALNKAIAAEVTSEGAPASVDITWSEWSEVWRRTRRVQAATASRDETRLEKHVMPRWGDVKLEAIKRQDVQAWVNELADTDLSASTVRKILHLLSASLKSAVAVGSLPANPCTGIELPKIAPSPERWLSVAEVAAIREVLSDAYRLTFEVLIGTGMRWGEAVALHWDHVDLDEKTIEVVWAWDRTGHTFKPPKTHSKRRVPIGDRLVSLLGARLDEVGFGEATDYVYAEMRKPRFGLVLGTSEGTPPNGVSFAHGLAAAGQAAFVGEGARRRRIGHVRPHDLRHSYASQLVQSGVPIQAVGKLLGHSSLTVTQRYAQVGESSWDAVRGVLG